MTVSSALAGMAEHPFVSLTTFRRSGDPVATPVWIARDGDALVVTTPADSGKVKRLRHDPRVELRPCTRRGAVAEGVEAVSATAEVVAPSASSTGALRAKYGLQYRLLTAVLEPIVRRGRHDRRIVRIPLAGPTP